MAQQTLGAKLDDLSLLSETHIVERTDYCKLSSDLHKGVPNTH